jgi:hypothetical protein
MYGMIAIKECKLLIIRDIFKKKQESKPIVTGENKYE